jgi:hypothetical protein
MTIVCAHAVYSRIRAFSETKKISVRDAIRQLSVGKIDHWRCRVDDSLAVIEKNLKASGH